MHDQRLDLSAEGPIPLTRSTAIRMARLLYGEPLDRLSHARVRDLALALEFAVRGRVPQAELAKALARLGQHADRERAAKELRAWLARQANERELLGQRRAA